MLVCVDCISFTIAPMKSKAKPNPADVSLSFDMTAELWRQLMMEHLPTYAVLPTKEGSAGLKIV